MDVLIIVAAIFVETLSAVIAAAAFFMLLAEYRRRRADHLLSFAAAFFCLAGGLLLLFLGQLVQAQGSGYAIPLLRVSQFLLACEGFFLTWALIRLYAGARYRLCLALALVLLALSGLGLAFSPAELVVVRGMAFIESGLTALLAMFATWLAAGLLLVFGPLALAMRERAKWYRPEGADRVLLNAGLTAFLAILIAVVSTALQIQFLIGLNFLALFAHVTLLLIGALSVGHPDPEIRKHPLLVIRRSLVLKAVGLNAFLFWLLALLLLSLTAAYFVDSSIQTRRAGLRRDLHYFTKSYSSYSLMLLEETERLALSADVAEALEKGTPMPERLRSFVTERPGARVLRIIDAAGTVVYSSHSVDEVGRPFASSRVLRQALMGAKVAAIEREEAFGIWSVRAGAPVTLEDGRLLGVILDTDVNAAFDFTEYFALSPVFAAGYGFVAENGDQVYAWGQSIDALTRVALRRQMRDGPFAMVQADERLYLVQRVFATDGVTDGYFYVFITQAMIDAEIFRVMSTMVLIVVLAVLLLTALLLFGMSVVLRPIRELRHAALRLEREDEVEPVAYRSPDEVGQLAGAFERMRTSIADRTADLRRALREEQDLLDNITRELRTPLNIFRWTLELMRYGDIGRFNREQLELLEQMHQTNERLIKLVQNLQDAIRIDRRRLALRTVELSVEDVLDEVAGALAVSIRKKNITLHWNRPKQRLPSVRADREYLQKILANLLSNAVKYTPSNGHIELRVAESHESSPGGRRGRFVRVVVEDNGMGIPEDEQDRVFTKFFRSKTVSGSEIEGAGLGLCLAKQLVELHGGDIWFKSKEGIGSTFSLTLPVVGEEGDASGDGKKEE